MKKIIEMSNTEAKDFFLKSSSYFNMALPEYFDFSSLLEDVDNKINNNTLISLQTTKPENIPNINFEINHNKDSKYAWRKFQMIHPALYINLVNIITQKNNWNTIIKRINEFKNNKNIICCSDLIESSSKKKDQGATINSWWNNFEQESIKMSLEFNWIGVTDITNCYGSIYTHSISWALHGIETAKTNKNNKKLIGNNIDQAIRCMNHGQTNGIPQGSTLMDFIAEIILGYGDTLISSAIKESDITSKEQYKILRYRDDYRIFTNSETTLNKILKILSEQLSKLNFKMNTNKTIISDDVISNSIKYDKIESLYLNLKQQKTIQKKLLLIRDFSKKHVNTGTLKKLLIELYKNDIEKIKNKSEDNIELISIVVDLMFKNSAIYPIAITILSKLLSFETDNTNIIQNIERKFSILPNTDYLSIWLQRITITYNKNKKFNSPICNKIYNKNTKIWNSDWINLDINENLILNEEIIDKLSPVIPSLTLDIFDRY